MTDENIQTCLRLRKFPFAVIQQRLMYKLIGLPEVGTWSTVSFLLLITIALFQLLSKFKRNWIFVSQRKFFVVKLFFSGQNLPEQQALHHSHKFAAYTASLALVSVLSTLLVAEFEALARKFAAFGLKMDDKLKIESIFVGYYID